MKTPFDEMGAALPCCCYRDHPDMCACPGGEAALRHYAGRADMPSMTAEQREWCLNEIGSVEGYDRAEHEGESDPVLAGLVLQAWTDYARDKGLI